MFLQIAVLRACNIIKKRLQHRSFPVNIAKFLRTAFFIVYLWWLLLHFDKNVVNLDRDKSLANNIESSDIIVPVFNAIKKYENY